MGVFGAGISELDAGVTRHACNHTVACPAVAVAVPQQELGKKLGHAPGHKKQLQDLWEKEDGLIGIRFNPKTFFKLHDMNDDSFFDRKFVHTKFELPHEHESRMWPCGYAAFCDL